MSKHKSFSLISQMTNLITGKDVWPEENMYFNHEKLTKKRKSSSETMVLSSAKFRGSPWLRAVHGSPATWSAGRVFYNSNVLIHNKVKLKVFQLFLAITKPVSLGMGNILSMTKSASLSKISHQHVSFKTISSVLVRGSLPRISLRRLMRSILP